MRKGRSQIAIQFAPSRFNEVYNRDGTFDVAQIARAELEKICDEVTASIQASQQSRFRWRKAKADQALNDRLHSAMKASDDSPLNVHEIVGEVEGGWKSTHGKVYKNFQRFCASLQAHEKVFAIFPSETMYTSVLSGCLSLVVQASVNHSSIAETLSQSVADISDKVASCAIYLEVTPTDSMKRRLAEIYAQLFRFYRDVLKWYLSSSASKVFGSLNATIKSRFDETVQSIEGQISQMVREGDIAALAIMRVVQLDQSEIKAQYSDIRSLLETVVVQQRRNYQDNDDAHIGVKVLESLGSVYKAMATRRNREASHGKATLVSQGRIEEGDSSGEMMSTSNDEANQLALRLQLYVVGDDGSKSLARGVSRTSEPIIPHKLKSLLNENEHSRTLWISATYSDRLNCTARTTALGFVAAAWKAGAPILSHFCDSPSKRLTTPYVGSLDAEQQAVLGLVYSLTRQLLQFSHSPQTPLDLSEARCERLRCDVDSWQEALELFRELLAATPSIRFCLIYGFNNNEWAKGAPWLRAVLDILFHHQQDQTGRHFHVLLVTSGQSRLLGAAIKASDRHIIQDGDIESV
ncbi:uncharacterized protein HMPREF1541_00176 [Cyphellophora europaea CBS 101466]|uniref:DUF7708 domain-containing protein n=1 Tax=Cyphellophora europaea (strain CBS 101466) TaxID=1220924 RepID=W2SD92_CYPE1|nr:uncharacterized protein HMPREF1541_00176 [Cyphellophora europaea CBS 101466]ETN45993.1 hypothetical protein HMPREF1541_00176 [Cyphellophora europaea CBS 101466]